MLLKMKTMRRNHTDAEVVEGIWRHDKNMEEWFYASARSYFDRHFKEVFSTRTANRRFSRPLS